MKPYQFFCYVAKYFKKKQQYEANPTPERLAQMARLESKITEEVTRVQNKLEEKSYHTAPNY